MAATSALDPHPPTRATAVQVFLGKGGVGKTTCAAATALALAEAGAPSLVISTDPTPSLSHIFELSGAHREREVRPALFLTELGIDDLRRMWDERFGREVYEVFSSFVDVDYASFVEFVTSVLPGLNEEFMVDYIRRLARAARYDHLIWDTAPLGQTLALLGMPTMLAEHLKLAPRIYSHLKAPGERRESLMAVIRGWQALAAECMEFLRREVRFSMVTIPEALAVQQLDGVVAELARYGLALGRLIVNNVVEDADSPFLRAKRDQQQPHIETLRRRYAALTIVEIPLFPGEVRGLERLATVGRRLIDASAGKR
ncbi:MAG TPA: ArsA family ATPase [Steroidobacteraceae bacterium]|nr:ArsA family ATPase [Steroidobacteraceae bacterium]